MIHPVSVRQWEAESEALRAEIKKLQAIASEQRIEIEQLRSQVRLKKRPVAYRVKDYGDGWIVFQDEREAYDYAEKTGGLMQGLYVRDGQER